jgi:hypothetical protein
MTDAAQRQHFNHSMFHGYDFDNTMLRIGSMNMLLHGVEAPDIRYRDSLSEGAASDEGATRSSSPTRPFAGSLDYESTSKALLKDVKTKKTELLFLALFLRLLKPGGRAAVIVPDGVLFGSSDAHKTLRKRLVEEQKLDAVVKLPSGAFRPYAGVSTAILFFTRTDSGGTEDVWFYDIQADGWSLDDKRSPLLAEDKLGCMPSAPLSADEHLKNNLPDVLGRWASRATESERARTEQSFLVPKADIVAQGYDLSLNRYKEVVHEEVEHRDPLDIIADLEALETRDPARPRRPQGDAHVKPAGGRGCHDHLRSHAQDRSGGVLGRRNPLGHPQGLERVGHCHDRAHASHHLGRWASQLRCHHPSGRLGALQFQSAHWSRRHQRGPHGDKSRLQEPCAQGGEAQCGVSISLVPGEPAATRSAGQRRDFQGGLKGRRFEG